MRPLRTERLRLTPVTVQNSGALWHVLQEPDLREYQDLPGAREADFAAMVAKRPRHLRVGASGRFEWLVYLHGHRSAIGWLSLRIADRGVRTGEIGYSIVRQRRGEGVATEAVRALIEEAFVQGEVDRLSAYCVPANVPSRKVLDNLGFRGLGLVHHGASIGGRPVDVLHHVIDRGEWYCAQSAKSIDMPASAYP